MEPINFKESNLTLTAPSAMPDCGDLPVYTDGKQCVSCWKPSWRERFKILFGGRIYLGVMGSRTQPPVWLKGGSPFYKRTIADRIRGVWYVLTNFFRNSVQFIKDMLKVVKTDRKRRKYFIAGAIISFVVAMTMSFLIKSGAVISTLIGTAAGFSAGSAAGVAKEYIDKKIRHDKADVMDWRSAVFGSAAGSIASGIIALIILLIIG